MTRYLTISATFLDSLFHGWGDDEPEWPPSPMRLFQALLAGSRTGCRNREWSPAKAAAFRWLATQPAPVIVAPEAHTTLGYTFYVPNNDSDRVYDRQDRLTTKVARPHRLSGGDTVHYLWPIEDGDHEAQGRAELLCLEARHLLALGWGIDQAVGNGRVLTAAQAGELSGRRWRSWLVHLPGARGGRGSLPESPEDLHRGHNSV